MNISWTEKMHQDNRFPVKHGKLLKEEAVQMNGKKLTRSRTDKVVAGVLGGVAEYVDMDSTVIRILFVILSIPISPLILVYLVAMFIMPKEAVSK